MKPEFLFIITYGRSGSTLVQGILNSIPGYRILGENNDALQKLREFYNCFYNSHANYLNNIMPEDDRNSWYNPTPPEELKSALVNTMAHIIDPKFEAVTLGFKEIRYSGHLDDLEPYLDWMYHIFDCKFLFLTRNLDHTCVSKWHAGNPAGCKAKLTMFEQQMEEYIKSRPYQNWFHLHFPDLHNVKPEEFKSLFDWLKADFDEAKIQEVLSRRHSY